MLVIWGRMPKRIRILRGPGEKVSELGRISELQPGKLLFEFKSHSRK